MSKILLFVLALAFTSAGVAQEKFWKSESEQSVLKKNIPRTLTPKIFGTFSLSFDQYKRFLNTAPVESFSNIMQGLEIAIPYPDNSFKKFRIVETKMMEDALAVQFPEIKTYVGQGIDEPSATIRIDYTNQGFHAYVISPSGSLFIDPYQQSNNYLYTTYFSKDYVNVAKEKFKCELNETFGQAARGSVTTAPLSGTCIGTQLRTYRAAISCTGEYARAVCPAGNVTVANTLSAIVTTMNRVNGVYQTELDVKMILVSAEASIIYTDSTTDPYTGNNDPTSLIAQSQTNITTVIGSSSFDIGHTFSTGGGGLASVGVVCNASNKAKGITGLASPVGDPYDIDYVAHEMGHQFGALHIFESEAGFCGGGNRTKTSAYEPGSGTTIMSYSGLCNSDNIQPNSDPYFHSKSFDEIIAYTLTGNGNTCASVSATGNNPPVVVMPASGTKIPKGTPFTLNGTASDIDGDSLTYSWEEWDLSNLNTGSAWNSGDTSTTAPLFKARIPKATPSRTFPDMAIILANYPSAPPAVMGGLKGETLPQVARDIKFRFVARDNKPNGGGVATGGNGCSSSATFKVVVTDDGPFKITAPNTAVNWLGGSTQTVTWNVANTNSASGINVQNVDILMSEDGGNTYTTVIASNTPNDGTESITVPNIATNSNVRFMVKASGNIFFDISNVNFTITFNFVLFDSLLQFTANPDGNTISLKWQTATEFNNKGFEVLRSEGNSNNFVKIGFITGAGTSSSIHNYTLLDNDVKQGVVYYYRLREVDFSNNSVYSEIKSARLGATGFFASVQPQPFRGSTNVYLKGIDKTDFQILVSDVMGRIVIKKEITNTEDSRVIPIDFNTQSSGVYFIKIFQNNIQTTLKAVKH